MWGLDIIAAAALASATPVTECTIALPAWCMVAVDSSVEMADRGETRIWRLHNAQVMDAAPIEIIESKNCDTARETTPRRVFSGEVERDGRMWWSIQYDVAASYACRIEFLLPRESDRSLRSYRQFLLTHIFVGGEQLFNLEGGEAGAQ